MKIVNANTIQNGEKEFIDAINAELDWVSIEKMIMEKHKLQLQDEVVYRDGDIIVHNDEIAYRLDFDITVSMSLLFNRNGECLEIDTPSGVEKEGEPFAGADLSGVEYVDGALEKRVDTVRDDANSELVIDRDLDDTSNIDALYTEGSEMDLHEDLGGIDEGDAEAFDGETPSSQELPENKNWSKVAPGLAAMIDDINQDS